MSTIRRIAGVLGHACVILALPMLAHGSGPLWRDLVAGANGVTAATGAGLAAFLSRADQLDLLLPVALVGATTGLGAILWLMVLPLTHEHAGASPEADLPLATVTPIRTVGSRAEHPGRPRAA